MVSNKQAYFILFKKFLYLIKCKEHLTIDGIQKIVNLRASMNNGISDELKQAFPNTIPVERPQIFNQKIFDPYWLAGFTSGEGCFGLNFFKSTTKLGETVRLKFYISQHDRDEQLIKSLIEYFKAGNVYNKQGKVINFEITKFEDLIEKVIPFFKSIRS